MAEALAAQDSSYIFTFNNGEKIKRKQLAELILEAIGEDKKHTSQIANEIGMNYQSVFAVIRTLETAEILISEKQNKHNMYKLPTKCGLDQIFNHKKKLDNFKIISKTKHKSEDFPNVSFGGTKGYESFSGTYNNIIYEGGE